MSPERDLGVWEALTPVAVAALFIACPSPWWIAGGYAIDAFVGEPDRRPHEDIDVGCLDRDQLTIRSALPGWDLHCADPPGTLRPWGPGELLSEPVHDVWARERPDRPWSVQLVINSSDGDDWVYRRDTRIRRPLSEIVWKWNGIPYLAPEVQLLFKSKTVREKDQRDFLDSLPLLDRDRRAWLQHALRTVDSDHPWLDLV